MMGWEVPGFSSDNTQDERRLGDARGYSTLED